MLIIIMEFIMSMSSTWRKVRPRYCFSAKARWPKVAAGRLVSVATTWDLIFKEKLNLDWSQL